MHERIIAISNHFVRTRSLGRQVYMCTGYPKAITYPDGSIPTEAIEVRGLPEGVEYHGLYLSLTSELRNSENGEYANPHLYVTHAEPITMKEARTWKPSQPQAHANAVPETEERGTSKDAGPVTGENVTDDSEPF